MNLGIFNAVEIQRPAREFSVNHTSVIFRFLVVLTDVVFVAVHVLQFDEGSNVNADSH